MAILSSAQTSRRVKRELKKQKALQKKMEIQEKKELYGEGWKAVEQKKLQRDIETTLGSNKTPKIYDSKDLYDFFEPMVLYSDENNKEICMDFAAFEEAEATYRPMIEEIDKELEEIKEQKKKDDEEEAMKNMTAIQRAAKQAKTEVEQEEERRQAKREREKREASEFFQDDGVSEVDDIFPTPESGIITEHTDDSTAKTERDLLREEIVRARGLSPQSIAKGRMNQVVATYFNRYVPLYDRHICTCCGQPKGIDQFYIGPNLACSSRVDKKGNYHLYICKECCQKLFAYFYSVVTKKNAELSMQYVCSYLNLYWDVDLFYMAKKSFEERDRKGTLLGSYIVTINENSPGKSFMNSPFLTGEQLQSEQRVVVVAKDEAPLDWDKDDAKNKKEVVRLLGYDPFDSVDNDEEKKILYADFLSILDEDIQQDYVKLQSALTIVKSFAKVRKLDEKMNYMEKTNAPLTEQKAVSDLKTKELKAISDFSRDSGFSERFKTKQNAGETSFTGIMKKMDERKYENELINKYDIQTSSTIQAAADASFAAIFKQLALSDAEVWKIASEQLEELNKLRSENDKLKEELRQSKYSLAELSLKEKARESGVNIDD